MELILTFNLLFIIAYTIILSKLSSGLQNLTVPEKPASKDHVSIIIALHDEEKNIHALLEHLDALDFPKNRYEVILVDDRSSDGTASLIKDACTQRPNFQFITIRQTPEGWGPKKYAVSQAVSRANGQIILLTDADGRPGPHWIQSMLLFFEPKVGMVLGYAPYRCDGPYNTLANRLMKLEYFSQAAIAAATTGLGVPATCVGTNLAYRRKLFLDLDGYGKFRHTISGDDDLLLSRVRTESSWEVAYALGSEAQVSNEAPRSWRKFYHQRLRFASKGFKYPLPMTLALMLYYFFNLSFLAMLLGLIVYPVFWKVSLFFLAIKMSAESRFLKNAASLLGEEVKGLRVLLASPLHILYVVYFGAAAQILSWKWVKNV